MTLPRFAETLKNHQTALTPKDIETLQVNIGKKCNQACHHCHVEAGPKRTEMMSWETMAHIISLVEHAPNVHTVDITGGAPELHQHFKTFVSKLTALNKKVIVRCNLTVLFEPGQEDTIDFYRDNQVEIVASLPCYQQDNVDKQRGKGVFDKSIRALQDLNKVGYGQVDSALKLHLVYNPVGPHLPPAQAVLEADYKKRLNEDFGILFNTLFTITNMPIKRYLWELQRDGLYEDYMQLLVDSFNPDSVKHLMCNSMLSLSWDGQMYDCDFNQMLSLPAETIKQNILDYDQLSKIKRDKVVVGQHCYGCTAGAGSSCGGALV